MSIQIAVTSSDGAHVDEHFGHCGAFYIVQLDTTGGLWRITDVRRTEPACRNFAHQEEHVQEIADMLSDCRCLMTYRIGMYPAYVFRSWGVYCQETAAEEPETIAQAVVRLRQSAVSGLISEREAPNE